MISAIHSSGMIVVVCYRAHLMGKVKPWLWTLIEAFGSTKILLEICFWQNNNNSNGNLSSTSRKKTLTEKCFCAIWGRAKLILKRVCSSKKVTKISDWSDVGLSAVLMFITICIVVQNVAENGGCNINLQNKLNLVIII